jgi:hypothetical protein
MAARANQRWLSIRNIIIYLETKFRPNRRIFVFGGHFVPWLPWQRPPFWIFSPPNSCHTLQWIFLQSFMKFDERSPNLFKIPPFLFPWQLRQSLSNLFRFFGLSRSTKCGCRSYHVSSIFVRRVTCYEHFCVFQFFPWQRRHFENSESNLSAHLLIVLNIPVSFIDFRSVVAEKRVG